MSKNNFIPRTDFWEKHDWIKESHDFDVKKFENALRTKGEDFFRKLGEKKALNLFHLAATEVPAYKDFLKKNKVDHRKIKKISDFSNIPITDKKNYIREYPLPGRCFGGVLSASKLLAMSSGTSGEPTYWPRSAFQEYEADIIHETLYKYSFGADERKTLVVIGFPMGIYVSGMATVLPTRMSLSKFSHATFVTPGNNKNEVLKIVKNLWDGYEQIILVGHPFFLKDVIETGNASGIRWGAKKIKMMFCSEGFNEVWRDHILREAGIKGDRSRALSTYGSSEMLLMGQETPFSIGSRFLIEKDPDLAEKFGFISSVPSIFQYNPLFRHIESVNNELIFTVAGGVPLIRFNMHDAGRVISFEEFKKNLGTSYGKIEKKEGEPWKLPFVVLYGRSDHTIKFYAANIYPEHVRLALDHEPFLDKITGKFAMCKVTGDNMEECLEINIEMTADANPHSSFSEEVRDRVFNRLREINKEFLDTSTHTDKDLRPIIRLWPNGHEKYFKPGLKPRFIVNEK